LPDSREQVAGDVSLPQFGLSSDKYAELVKSCSIVYHLAAVASFTLTFQQLKAANVDGAVHVLRFACASVPAKTVHHVSTLSVFGDWQRSEQRAESPFPFQARWRIKRR
ncbi:SDR family oxidoreductase, partial [Enterobacter sp. 56-7]|uniref:SDR family oxidoreductase n=1 Tax=Enterobacter sp. 56-7 TaxID=1895906 RepID=UPI00257DD7DB